MVLLLLLPGGHVPEQSRARVGLLPQRNGPAVYFAMAAHLAERVVGDGAAEFDVGLETPVPLVWAQGFEIIKSTECVLVPKKWA